MNTKTRVIFKMMAIVCLYSAVCLADPAARPAESWDEYDFIGRVRIISIDSTREIQTYASAETKAYACPVEMEVTETMRMLVGMASPLKFLVPSYSIIKGKRLECPPIAASNYNVTSNIAVACRFIDNKQWLLVEWELTDEMWESYRKQKDAGAVGQKSTAIDETGEELRNAIKADREIYEKAKRGEISWEEYHEQVAPFREIINRQFDEINTDR